MTPRQERDRPLPEGDEKARTVRRLFDTISPRYDFVNRVMTLGMDVGWRRRTVRELALPAGSRILDLACGTGDLCRELLAAGHRPVGFDFSHGMLLAAKTDAPLVEADILQLPVRDASADGATCGFALRNVVSLEGLFAELARVVRKGGRIALLETAEPEGSRDAARASRVLPRGRAGDRRAALEPRGLLVPPSIDGIPACAARKCWRCSARPGSPTRGGIALGGGVTQLLVATRA